MLIHAMPLDAIPTLKTQIEQALAPCRSLEEAAQTCTNLLFETFEESLILIRFFATIPYNALPPAYQAVVNMMANPEKTAPALQDDTPVLTLLGTRGGEEDLRNTRHAFGIPLASTDFVDSIPIVAQLLKEIGFELDWEARQRSLVQEPDIETDSTGFLAGMLYVPNAQRALNRHGENLAQAIAQLPLYSAAAAADMQTIFGIGGAYIQGPYIAAIMFSREHLEKARIERLLPVANYFKTTTLKLVAEGQFFT